MRSCFLQKYSKGGIPSNATSGYPSPEKGLDTLIDAESKVNALETGITYPKRFFRIWPGLFLLLLLQECCE